MDNITVQCPSCNQLAEHIYNGLQSGLPVRDNSGNPVKDSSGNYVLKSGELWTCNYCNSTWFKEIS